ncbi:MAG: NIPSNAP family protein [Pseudomonadota bacterium]
MINQLRIYTVPAANRGPFLDRFRDHAARIMARHGFRIQAMWMTEGEAGNDPKFVYLLAWKDRGELEARWAAFMADEDWAEIKRVTSAEHGTFVLGIEDLALDPVDFSAAIGEAS